MKDYPFDPYVDYHEYPPDEMRTRAHEFYEEMRRRRTVREFSDRPVPRDVIEHALLSAGTAPNGANMQPWRFLVVENKEAKRRIRLEAEAHEREFYERIATPEWLEVLAPLGTDEHKPYLETAPYLIVIFIVKHTVKEDGSIMKHYYMPESVGIATGILITALHHAGLATLTHTPSPMGFLNEILGRPDSERPFLILVVGYPAVNAKVPRITKKRLDEIASFV